MSSDSASTVVSLTQAEWFSQNVLLCEAGLRLALALRRNFDRLEFKKLSDELLSMLPTCLQNNVVVRAPFAANYQISFGIKGGGGRDLCREVRDALVSRN